MTDKSYASKVSEDCGKQLGNLYKVPLVAAARYRQIKKDYTKENASPLSNQKDFYPPKGKFQALEEIERGLVK